MMRIVPAEWAPHRALWLGFPSHADLWEDDLGPAQDEVADLARALAGPGRERVRLLVSGDDAAEAARGRLDGVGGVSVETALFGDVWLRDTGPIFTGPGRAAAFRFNGWGGKYRLEGDQSVGAEIARRAGACLSPHDFVLEGGAVDHDGAGTVLTTRQCLLNPNRNRGWTEAEAELALAGALGSRKVLWLGDGVAGDHTDGHVDNLARFIGPGLVACPCAADPGDPNAAIFEAAARVLAGFTDAEGRALTVARAPSPGRVLDEEGKIAPASHMNFIIANGAVIVPTFEAASGAAAVAALAPLFPGREVIGLSARALLTGGGAFHCISQQEPA